MSLSSETKVLEVPDVAVTTEGQPGYALLPTQPAQAEKPMADWVLIATDAYEGGFGKGLQAAETGKELANPWGDEPGREAWSLGYAMGKERYQPKAAQQEPVAWMPKTWTERYVSGVSAVTCYLRETPGWIPLYTAAAPQREPMTGEQMVQVYKDAADHQERDPNLGGLASIDAAISKEQS